MTLEDLMLSFEELKSKTVFELKSIAKKNNVDLRDAKTKVEILNAFLGIENIKIEKQELPDKVALYSVKNKHNSQIGSLKFGYNIVTKEVADKWLAIKGVRLATPEEVANYYGK